jgi:CheY-like chemotaxis protein
MKVLVVEDEPKIKTETIDDCLGSLGHVSDWAQNQQDANGLLTANDYDLVLLDLQIPSRPNGKASPEFGKNLLKQIRARKGRDGIPVILMTAQHQDCVGLLTDLQECHVDGSIAKPFPTTGRTLAVVIEDVLEKHRRFRVASKGNGQSESLTPFPGGDLAELPHGGAFERGTGLAFVIEMQAAPHLAWFTGCFGAVAAGQALGIAGGEVHQLLDGLTSINGVAGWRRLAHGFINESAALFDPVAPGAIRPLPDAPIRPCRRATGGRVRAAVWLR